MNVGSTKEQNPEKRISITPDTCKSFKNLGLNVFIEKGYGENLGYNDKDYKDNGAEILNNSLTNLLLLQKARVCSSVVERYVDIVEVISSILITPTKKY